MFKKSFVYQGTPNTPRINKGKGCILTSQEGKCSGPYVEKTIYAKCGRKHEGKCLVGTDNFCCCSKSGHMKRDCPMLKAQ